MLLIVGIFFLAAFMICYLKVGFRFVNLENEHASRIVMGEERAREVYRSLLARNHLEAEEGA